MRAMVLGRPGAALEMRELPVPQVGEGQLLIRVYACGVCRTDLHVVDGELANPKLPLVPGHEVVGRVERVGIGVSGFREGDRVGVPWLGYACGVCRYCTSGRENLCDYAKFTGYQIDGGYTEYTAADSRFCFPIPDAYSNVHAAPLLCAGLIGYRALTLAGEGERLGLYGFGAAAHIVAQVAHHRGWELYAFTRPGDAEGQRFARELGAAWAGGSDEAPPEPLDAAIIFAPVGALVPTALRATAKGGTVVCAGIHMSDIPSFPYATLWGERTLRSVANLTRQDAAEYLPLASGLPVRPRFRTWHLDDANAAVRSLREGITGCAVLSLHP